MKSKFSVVARAIPYLIICSICGMSSSALAQSATDTQSFTGTVALECGLSDPGLGDDGSPVTYNVGTGTVDGGITRTISLSATDTSSFDCNSDLVQVQISLDGLSPAPDSFSNATAIDRLATAATGPGIDHALTIAVPGNFPQTLNARQAPVNSLFNGFGATDSQGDILIEVTSSFSTAGGAEELAAATYSADLTVQVTAQ